MKQFQFPYQKYKGDFYPVIPLQLKRHNSYSKTEAYVDSGASISIFTMAVAQQIGINVTKGKPNYVLVGDGGYMQMYLRTVTVKLGTIIFPATIGFSSHLGSEMNLIGQKDFFDRFIITLNKPHSLIS